MALAAVSFKAARLLGEERGKNPAEGVSQRAEPPGPGPEIFLLIKVPLAPAPDGNAAGGQQFLPQGGKKKKEMLNFANCIITLKIARLPWRCWEVSQPVATPGFIRRRRSLDK